MKKKLMPARPEVVKDYEAYTLEKYGRGVRRSAYLAIAFICSTRLPATKVTGRVRSLFRHFIDAMDAEWNPASETPVWNYALGYADRRVK